MSLELHGLKWGKHWQCDSVEEVLARSVLTCRDGKPYFHWIANMHGDEPSGRQLTIATALYMCENRHDVTVQSTLERMHVVIVPTLNPDGFAASTRSNRCGPWLQSCTSPDTLMMPSSRFCAWRSTRHQLQGTPLSSTLHVGLARDRAPLSPPCQVCQGVHVFCHQRMSTMRAFMPTTHARQLLLHATFW
jgi:hypothetical protein